MAIVVAPFQALIGDVNGLNTLKHQSVKIAALKVTGKLRPQRRLRWWAGRMEAERNRYALEIPELGSLILMHSLDKQVPALKDYPKEDLPNSTVVFWSFHIMVGMSVLMILLGGSLWLRYRNRLYHSRPFMHFVLWMGPSGDGGLLK